MTIWDSICHSQWFKQTSIVSLKGSNQIVTADEFPKILFLNKNDLFEKKIAHSDIKNYFPVSNAILR
jgi:guanine nucleotide-binding protein subunit alpha, other